MSDLDAILAILTGKKVKHGNKWKVYDANDVEIVDADGVLLSGLHGFLLNNSVNVDYLFASLGGTPYDQKKPRSRAIDDEVEESLSAATISRIRNEFLSEALANDLINRAKVRKARAEEEALLLMI